MIYPTIIIIQNTDYHFETTLSLYKILNDLGYECKIYRCKQLNNQFNQIHFLAKHDIQTISLENINNQMIGLVVSTYPNPKVSIENAIPNNNDAIFSVMHKLIYISHRFKNYNDYSDLINADNTLCLSKLSNNIGIDYLYLTNMPFAPVCSEYDKSLRLTIQGHFRLASRHLLQFRRIVQIIGEIIQDKQLIINIVGTHTTIMSQALQNLNIKNCIIKLYNSIDEENFYDILNNETDWLLPLLTPDLKNNTYAIERYSSNFNMAIVLQKPIFSHDFFQNIYMIPGIYFNDSNLIKSLVRLVQMNKTEYKDMVREFDLLIPQWQNHNKIVLEKKINYVNQI